MTARLFRVLNQCLTCHGGHDVSLNLPYMQPVHKVHSELKAAMQQGTALRLLLRCWLNANKTQITTEDVPQVRDELRFLLVAADTFIETPDLAMVSDRSAVAIRRSNASTECYLGSRDCVPSSPISTLLQAATRTATLGTLVMNPLTPASQVST